MGVESFVGLTCPLSGDVHAMPSWPEKKRKEEKRREKKRKEEKSLPSTFHIENLMGNRKNVHQKRHKIATHTGD